jgi:TonB family protein
MAADGVRRSQVPQKDAGRDKVSMIEKKRGMDKKASGQEGVAFEIPTQSRQEALNFKLDMKEGELSSLRFKEGIQGNSHRFRLPSTRRGDTATEVGDGGEHPNTVLRFRPPSLAQLDMVTGAPANDHIEDVAEGQETLLNSREFKYATFFNRVKRGVSQHWSPSVASLYMRHDPYGNIYGVKDRHTLLSVSLDDSGDLMDISISQSSGLKFFDDFAMESFRQASPFPNPPHGLIEQGLITFQFGFYFTVGERPSIRAYNRKRRNRF